MSSHSILLGSDRSQLQFISDLTNLCKRHKISYGRPQDLTHFGADLASNDNFKVDLFTLCTAISHMAETDLSSEQLLILVAHAFGGYGGSIGDANVDLPPATRSAFLEGYKKWTLREPDPDACAPWQIDPDQAPVSSRPGPTLVYTAASRIAADARGTQDARSPRHIPASTPLESLTLSELRMYLEEIESRVSQIEPRLERVTSQQELSFPKHFEQLEPLEAPRISEAHATVASEHPKPAIASETITPDEQETLVLDDLTSSPFPSQQDPIVADIPSSATDATRLRRLRIVNSVLTLLLILVCGSAAIFGYRYLHPQPAVSADATHPSPIPLEQLPSQSSPAGQPVKEVLPHNIALTAASSIPPSIHLSGNTDSENSADTHPVQTLTTGPTAPAPVLPQPRQADAKTSEPISTPAEALTQPHSNPPTAIPPAPDTQDHTQAKLPPPNAQPNLTSAEPDHLSRPLTVSPLVASATPAPPAPVVTSTPPTPPTIPHLVRPNTPVSVPGAMMMTYAVSAPKPIYPNFRHLSMDSEIEVEATISKDGKVTNVRAVNGPLDVRGAALRAVQDWRFRPFTLEGSPVAVVTTFKFVFKGR
jgi:protein TonB